MDAASSHLFCSADGGLDALPTSCGCHFCRRDSRTVAGPPATHCAAGGPNYSIQLRCAVACFQGGEGWRVCVWHRDQGAAVEHDACGARVLRDVDHAVPGTPPTAPSHAGTCGQRETRARPRAGSPCIPNGAPPLGSYGDIPTVPSSTTQDAHTQCWSCSNQRSVSAGSWQQTPAPAVGTVHQ